MLKVSSGLEWNHNKYKNDVTTWHWKGGRDQLTWWCQRTLCIVVCWRQQQHQPLANSRGWSLWIPLTNSILCISLSYTTLWAPPLPIFVPSPLGDVNQMESRSRTPPTLVYARVFTRQKKWNPNSFSDPKVAQESLQSILRNLWIDIMISFQFKIDFTTLWLYDCVTLRLGPRLRAALSVSLGRSSHGRQPRPTREAS